MDVCLCPLQASVSAAGGEGEGEGEGEGRRLLQEGKSNPHNPHTCTHMHMVDVNTLSDVAWRAAESHIATSSIPIPPRCTSGEGEGEGGGEPAAAADGTTSVATSTPCFPKFASPEEFLAYLDGTL
jgi:hypothetical protein